MMEDLEMRKYIICSGNRRIIQHLGNTACMEQQQERPGASESREFIRSFSVYQPERHQVS